MPKKPESIVAEKIVKALNESFQGFYFNVNGSPYQSKGISDILGCYQGRFIAVEVKRPLGESSYGLTSHQKRFLKNINRNGGIGISARTPEEAVNKLNDLLLPGSVLHQGNKTKEGVSSCKIKRRSTKKTYGL